MANQVFILPKQPDETDNRPRNAFDFLSPKLRQVIAEAHPREIRMLAAYINNYLTEEADKERYLTGSIINAIEAFGGGAE